MTDLADHFREIKAGQERKQRALALKTRVRELEKTMRCTCDLDRWEPERETGHSWVCGIHKAIIREKAND